MKGSTFSVFLRLWENRGFESGARTAGRMRHRRTAQLAASDAACCYLCRRRGQKRDGEDP
jgi:hypothetical protein